MTATPRISYAISCNVGESKFIRLIARLAADISVVMSCHFPSLFFSLLATTSCDSHSTGHLTGSLIFWWNILSSSASIALTKWNCCRLYALLTGWALLSTWSLTGWFFNRPTFRWRHRRSLSLICGSSFSLHSGLCWLIQVLSLQRLFAERFRC